MIKMYMFYRLCQIFTQEFEKNENEIIKIIIDQQAQLPVNIDDEMIEKLETIEKYMREIQMVIIDEFISTLDVEIQRKIKTYMEEVIDKGVKP